jgi:hypothetical protein
MLEIVNIFARYESVAKFDIFATVNIFANKNYCFRSIFLVKSEIFLS